MSKKVKTNTKKIKIIVAILILSIIFSSIILWSMSNKDGNTRSLQGQRETFKYNIVKQDNLDNKAQDSPSVTAEVINGKAMIAIKAGHEPSKPSKLEVENVSQTTDGPYQILEFTINQSFNDLFGVPNNPRLLLEIPDIKPGKHKIKITINQRNPNSSGERGKMETFNKKELKTEFSYTDR